MEKFEPSRRKFLQSLGVTAVGMTLAGCNDQKPNEAKDIAPAKIKKNKHQEGCLVTHGKDSPIIGESGPNTQCIETFGKGSPIITNGNDTTVVIDGGVTVTNDGVFINGKKVPSDEEK